MISLNTTGDTIVMLIVAGIVGAVAGIGGFALQNRSATGTDQYLGWPASMLLGGLASLGILYFFSPVTNTTVTTATGAVKTSSHYDLVKLVALAVIVGSGGRAFLAALQARTSTLLSQQTSANMLNQLPKALDDAKEKIADDTANVAATIDQHANTLTELAADPNAPEPVKAAAEALEATKSELSSVAEQAQAHIGEAQGRIEAAAAPLSPQQSPMKSTGVPDPAAPATGPDEKAANG
jgi:hypothetical protein